MSVERDCEERVRREGDGSHGSPERRLGVQEESPPPSLFLLKRKMSGGSTRFRQRATATSTTTCTLRTGRDGTGGTGSSTTAFLSKGGRRGEEMQRTRQQCTRQGGEDKTRAGAGKAEGEEGQLSRHLHHTLGFGARHPPSCAAGAAAAGEPRSSISCSGPATDEDGSAMIEVVEWVCTECNRKCIPIRSESRCICGHRLKDHLPKPKSLRAGHHQQQQQHQQQKGRRTKPWACTSAGCACRKFKYIVAEGAWILRCRCKHKHTDHDPNPPHLCRKPQCTTCEGFDSPWVCNCNHPWASHVQKFVKKPRSSSFFSEADLSDLGGVVARTDLQEAPLGLRGNT